MAKKTTIEDAPMKEYMIDIDPMYVGDGKDKKMEMMMSVKVLNSAGNYDEYQAVVPKRSRLEQEIKKVLEGINKQKNATPEREK